MKTQIMLSESLEEQRVGSYVGMDYHKKYSFLSVIDGRGQRLKEGRINGNLPVLFEQFLKDLPRPIHVVMEAGWTWIKPYQILEDLGCVEKIVLANPYKTRLIAEAQIKTDRIDARVLAMLLKGNLIAEVHVPSAWSRDNKELLRQRGFWVKQRTQIRNRVHRLIDKQPQVASPQMSDLFGNQGKHWLKSVVLPEGDRRLLDQNLEMLEHLEGSVKALNKRISASIHEDVRLLLSMPGIGQTLAPLIAAEIDGIQRFSHAAKLCSYAGLVPSTSASGGKVSQGRILGICNKWLRWALVEAAWVAIGKDAYLGNLYQQAKAHGKCSNKAIILVARRMCEIIWQMLKNKRIYETFPGRSCRGLKEPLATS